MPRDWVVAVSLANLLFAPVWYRLIGLSRNPAAQWANYDRNGCLAAMLGVVAVAIALRAAVAAARRSGREWAMRVARAGFVVAVLLAAHGIVQAEFPGLALRERALAGSAAGWALALVAIGGTVVASASTAVRRICIVAITVLSPFALMTFGQALWLLVELEERPLAPPLTTALPPRRIVWLVFDELDARLAFTERPAGLALPELDRLRAEAVVAGAALPPASQTLRSMPALITGRIVVDTQPAGPSDRLLVFADTGEVARWSAGPNVFTRARAVGANTALVGWYHPYCRILGASLTACAVRDGYGLPLLATLADHLRTIALKSPVRALLPSVDARVADAATVSGKDVERYRATLADAKRFAVDPALGLVLVHWPIPHLPVIYDRRTRAFACGDACNYLDNLALTDRTLGELRRAMEAAGIWDDTTVLLTSDHPLKPKRWREKLRNLPAADVDAIIGRRDRHVPFLLKLAGQHDSVVIAREFNTVLTADLLVAILRGELATPDDVVAWLTAKPH